MSDISSAKPCLAEAAVNAANEAQSLSGSLGEIMRGAGEEKLAGELARAALALRRLAAKAEKRGETAE